MSYPLVGIILNLIDAGGNPVTSGTAVFTPTSAVSGSDGIEEIVPQPITVRLDNGTFPVSATLLPTDIAAIPSSWAWQVAFTGVELDAFTFKAPAGPVNFTGATGTPGVVTWTATGAVTSLPVGTGVKATGGSLPAGLTAGTTYFVVSASGQTLSLSATAGGSPVPFTGSGSGTLTVVSYYLAGLSPVAPSTSFSQFMAAPSGSPLAGQVPVVIANGSAATRFETLTAGGSIPSGTDASLPAASSGNSGTFYYAEDTGILYQSDGTLWDIAFTNTEGPSAPENPVYPALTYLLPPGSTTSAVTASGGLTIANDTVNFAKGGQSIRCTTDGAGGSNILTLSLGSAVDLSDKIVVIGVEVDSFTPYSDLQLRLSSDAFATSNYDFSRFTYTGATQRWVEPGKWSNVTLNRGRQAGNMSPGQWAVAGTGLANYASVNAIRIMAKDLGGSAPMTFRIGWIGYFTRPAQGMVSVTFDDSRLTQFTVAKPAMDAVGIRGTIYNIAESVAGATAGTSGYSGYFTEAQMRKFTDDGWEMGAHAFTDVLGVQAHTVGYDSLNAHDGTVDLTQLKTWLRQQSANGIDTFALPHGTWSANVSGIQDPNTDVLGMVKKYFNTCVTTILNTVETYPPSDPKKLRRYVATNADTATSIMAMVTAAAANNWWLILAFHNLVSPASGQTDFLPSEFTSFITQLAASGVATPTVGEVWRQAGAAPWATRAPSGVTAGAYTSANITVDSSGRVTAAANGSGGSGGASLDSLATTYPTAGAVAMNGQKLTGMAAGSTAGNAAAWEQLAGPSPADVGLLAWNGDPAWMNATSSTVLTAGTVYISQFVNRKVQTFTNLLYYVGTAGATLTTGQCFAGIYDSAGALRATTADQSVNFATTGVHTAAFTAPYANAPVGIYYFAFMFNGATGPEFKGSGAPSALYNAGLSGANLRCATTSSTGNTTALPATITLSGNSSTASTPAWGALT